MKVLFLTIGTFLGINEHGIYSDLMREFLRNGHEVYVMCANEKRTGLSTSYEEEGNAHVLRIKTGNITQAGLLEKGISTVLIKGQYLSALKKYYKGNKFDLVLYPTPPITLCGVVEYIKKRDGAKTYLLLKDIFPQNAVDLGMMSTSGIKSVIYRYFRRKERKIYQISDKIGCMSAANADYILKHNPEVKARNDRERKRNGKDIVEVCPNCMEPADMSISREERAEIRKKYDIPTDKTVFIYGGNLGKPQGVSFMLKCLHSQRENDKVFFLIVGNGTEYRRIEQYMEKYKPGNIALRQWLPRDEYDKVVAACDVGMIFLDHRFTIPNFPSRLLGYMAAKLPVLAVTDTTTDMGKVILEGGFGWWCESNDVERFVAAIGQIMKSDFEKEKERGYQYLLEHYTTKEAYIKIMH